MALSSERPNESVWPTLVSAAEMARAHAHAPYSEFYVGAALLTSDGEIFAGCNVENASYGLTICAERNAVFSAVAERGAPEIVAVYITTQPEIPAPPCGACLQVLAEFALDAEISFVSDEGRSTARLPELLPAGFRLKTKVGGVAVRKTVV